MSGGVDSSVAAKLLKDQGYNVLGIFLYFWKEESIGDEQFENKCCSAKAYLDANRVCQKLGIRLYTLNFGRVFKKEVVDNFLKEYACGRTPNPCVRCNKLVKIGLLIKKAKELGYDYVATGHYARIKRKAQNAKRKTKEFKLLRGKDKKKDQSYFLYTLTQEQLSHLIFPLGDYTKDEVRKMAKKFKLPVAKKKDSQEICFIPEKNHNEFLKRHIKMKPGQITVLLPLNKGETKRESKTVGRHQGLPLYTIGQRKGVEIGGIGPFYVAKTDYKTNTLFVVKDAHDPFLYSDSFKIKNINWISGKKPKLPLKCRVVIRYGHKAEKCEVIKLKVKSNNEYKVEFTKPQRAITPGQSGVFYKGEEILGGGIISVR